MRNLGAIFVLLATSAALIRAQSGSGKTTTYWDCCKPSCAWAGKGESGNPVGSCDKDDKPLSDLNTLSACQGGAAYMCSSQAPWAVHDNLAYGFASVSAANSPECCQCYQLTFTSGAVQGKKMIVQATNTGTDVDSTQFDLSMPGGGFGIYDACTSQWSATSSVWGQQYGGTQSNTCSQFPSQLQAGCGFKWDWYQGANVPTVDYEVIPCPSELVAKSGCGTASGNGTDSSNGTLPSSGSSASGGSNAPSTIPPLVLPSMTASGTAVSPSTTTDADEDDGDECEL